MAQRTSIEVTEATWNPITGCDPVSPGCRRCYARRFAARLAGRYGYPAEDPFAVTVHEDRLTEPGRWKKPRHIFVCSMGDPFHRDVPFGGLLKMLEVMAEVNRHTYFLLTKRPALMAECLAAASDDLITGLTRHVWLGVSVEDQERARERIPTLLEAWPGTAVVCAEPLQGPVDLAPWIGRISWVISGGETGPGGEIADPRAVRSLRDQCVEAEVPFAFKQWGGPDKKRTGRLLDGMIWNQRPSP